MRRSRDSDNQILVTADGTPYGVFLAADYCGQHECGIESIERLFGIDRSLPGIPGRMITRTPDRSIVLDKTVRVETPESRKGRRRYKSLPVKVLIFDDHHNPDGFFDSSLKRYDFLPEETALVGAFSDRAFAMAGYTNAAAAAIDTIIQGIQTVDLAVMMGGGSANPFARGGLVVCRASMIPEEQAKVTLEADLESIRLAEAAAATGIIAKLDSAPVESWRYPMRRYHALSPAWVDRFQSLVGREGRPADQTKHPVIFFLNPTQQSENNHGWFTVEELELWLEGKGPIPKSAKAA